MGQVITDLILPLLVYSGPLFTYGTVVRLYPTAERVRFYRWSIIVHALMFLPFVVLLIRGNEDAMHSLTLPAATGLFFFCSGAVYLIYVSLKSRRKHA